MTPREIQVLHLVRRRLSNKEIAQLLAICESTVKFHVSNILGKLQVGSRQDLLLERQPLQAWERLLHKTPT